MRRRVYEVRERGERVRRRVYEVREGRESEKESV